MTTFTTDDRESAVGACGCGRSPTGKCCGWHGLSEEMYAHQKMLWMEEQFRLDQEKEDDQRGKE
jgi:hypothetical protein